jgi:hypothetical protein
VQDDVLGARLLRKGYRLVLDSRWQYDGQESSFTRVTEVPLAIFLRWILREGKTDKQVAEAMTKQAEVLSKLSAVLEEMEKRHAS